MQTDSKIFIIAGEASGDANGASLVDDILKINNNITFYGIGGPKLQGKNVNIIRDYSTVNYIGFSNVIKNLKKIKRILRETVEYTRNLNPDLVILIDFPGFNLKFAELVKKFYKGKIIYYISPQIWIWHKSRIKKIRKYIDRMLVIFPFEVDFYKKLNYNADYVGHPLVKKIEQFLENNKKVKPEVPSICLLPGSRIEEIQRILPILARAAEVIRINFGAEINIIHPENIKPRTYKRILKGRYCNFIPNIGDNHLTALLNSDLVLTKFGTTTLELTILNVPFIPVYKAGIFNYVVAKTLSDLKYTSMPNILSGKEIVKEFIQSDMTAEKIFAESKKILTDNNYKDRILKELKEVHNKFKNTPVKKTAAEIIAEELSNRNL